MMNAFLTEKTFKTGVSVNDYIFIYLKKLDLKLKLKKIKELSEKIFLWQCCARRFMGRIGRSS